MVTPPGWFKGFCLFLGTHIYVSLVIEMLATGERERHFSNSGFPYLQTCSSYLSGTWGCLTRNLRVKRQIKVKRVSKDRIFLGLTVILEKRKQVSSKKNNTPTHAPPISKEHQNNNIHYYSLLEISAFTRLAQWVIPSNFERLDCVFLLLQTLSAQSWWVFRWPQAC